MPVVGCRPRPYRVQYTFVKGLGRVEVRTKNNGSIWDLTKKYINKLENEETFTRLDLLNYVYCGYGENIRKFETSVDHYRNQLTHVKVLKVVGRGIYKKLRNVPIKLTTTQLRKISNQNNWESWFIPLEEFD